MVYPVLRPSDLLAAFLSSFKPWPDVSRSHSSSGRLWKGRELWLSKRFKLAGGVMVVLGVLWFGSLFIHKFLCPSVEPLFCKGMRCKVKAECAACPVFWTSSAKQISVMWL